MDPSFRGTVDALIGYLEQLKRQGNRYVTVSPETLKTLQQPVPRRAAMPRAPKSEKTAPVLSRQDPPADAGHSGAAPRVPSGGNASLASVAPTTTPVVGGEDDRAAAIEALRERAVVCQKCPHLARSRKNVVFGVGDIYSPLMFVGEAPGADEDEQGEPFVGRAGQLLTRIIQTMGFSRETVYIANILKCRPDTPGQASGNRKPTSDEMKTCLPYLLAQIDLIRPKVIVALGSTAVEGLIGGPVAITKMRGRFLKLRDIPLMPTYHPSYLLRNQALSTKREVWEDMLQVMDLLNLPISEKQRSYFLKAG